MAYMLVWEYLATSRLEVPVVSRDLLERELVLEYLLACHFEVPVVSGDLLARQLVSEYMLACQLAFPYVVPSHLLQRQLKCTPVGTGVSDGMLVGSSGCTGKSIGTSVGMGIP